MTQSCKSKHKRDYISEQFTLLLSISCILSHIFIEFKAATLFHYLPIILLLNCQYTVQVYQMLDHSEQWNYNPHRHNPSVRLFRSPALIVIAVKNN